MATYRGEPVAVILPGKKDEQPEEMARALAAEPSSDIWAELDALRCAIDAS